MKYYLVGWEHQGNPIPRIRNWMERLDYQTVQKKEINRLPERSILFLEENPDTVFSDVIEQPFLLVSNMVWEVSKMYGIAAKGKEIILLDGKNGFAEIYYMPVFPKYACLSDASVWNQAGSALCEIVLDEKKAVTAPVVFRIAETEKEYLVCRLDFVESILRRGAKGIRVTELEMK